jgi:Trk K+ transport system NAD-binding subunit
MKKLERAGADTVISPAVIAAQQLVQSALGTISDDEFNFLNDQTEDGRRTE